MVYFELCGGLWLYARLATWYRQEAAMIAASCLYQVLCENTQQPSYKQCKAPPPPQKRQAMCRLVSLIPRPKAKCCVPIERKCSCISECT